MSDRYRGPLTSTRVSPAPSPPLRILQLLAATIVLLLLSLVLRAAGVPAPIPCVVALLGAALALANVVRSAAWALSWKARR